MAVEPHICSIANRTPDPRGEFVEIANAGAQRVALTGLELTDYTETQRRPHIFRFPPTTNQQTLYLEPRESAYVFSGLGENCRSDSGSLLLFWGLRHAVWNDDGDVAYLRRSDGTFIDTHIVGHPKRHPGGH
jgi:hypothetical protein